MFSLQIGPWNVDSKGLHQHSFLRRWLNLATWCWLGLLCVVFPGKQMIETYFDFRLYRLWKTRQHSKLLDYDDILWAKRAVAESGLVLLESQVSCRGKERDLFAGTGEALGAPSGVVVCAAEQNRSVVGTSGDLERAACLPGVQCLMEGALLEQDRIGISSWNWADFLITKGQTPLQVLFKQTFQAQVFLTTKTQLIIFYSPAPFFSCYQNGGSIACVQCPVVSCADVASSFTGKGTPCSTLRAFEMWGLKWSEMD